MMNYDDIYDNYVPVPLKNEICEQKEKLHEHIWCGIRIRNRIVTLRSVAWSVAAMAALALTTTFLLSQKTVVSGKEEIAVELPCGSSVKLDADAQLRYNGLMWMFVRRVELKGGASFDVAKGRRFDVMLPVGKVTVLGTQFHVKSDDESMRVECYEGAVGVSDFKNHQVALNAGERVDCTADGMKTSQIVEPLPQYLTFNDVRLIVVVEKMKEIFGLIFDDDAVFNQYIYTGFLPTENVDQALDIVFGACALNYSLHDRQVVILKNK